MPVTASSQTQGTSEPSRVTALEAPAGRTDPEEAAAGLEHISKCQRLGAQEMATACHLPQIPSSLLQGWDCHHPLPSVTLCQLEGSHA